MAESNVRVSGERNEGSSSSEDDVYVPDLRNVVPYSFEPERDTSSGPDSSDGDEDEEDDEDGSYPNRLTDLQSWCQCNNCQIMPTARECVCCLEYPKILQKNGEAPEEVPCITEHPGFHGVCLNPWVLQAAYYQYRELYGPIAAPSHERYRYTAYRQLVRWCWGYMGKNYRIVLPSCAVQKIRDTFPSEEYVGFQYPAI